MNKKNKKNVPLIKSILCGIKGIITCFKNERNLRFHFGVCFYVVWLANYYDFSVIEKLILILTVGSVIVTELLNTAIEYIVDLISPDFNQYAGKIKDISAGAVLFTAFTSILIGFLLFWDIATFKYILSNFVDKPYLIAIFIITFCIWIKIIFVKGKTKNED